MEGTEARGGISAALRRGQLLGLLLLWSVSGAPVPALGLRLRFGLRPYQWPVSRAFTGVNAVTQSVIREPEPAAPAEGKVTRRHGE